MEDIQFNRLEAYILGAGGFARELESWTEQTRSFNKKYNLVGFLDDDPHALALYRSPYGIVGDLSANTIADVKHVIIGIANSQVKEKLLLSCESYDVNFIDFIHHLSAIGNETNYGKGLVVCPFVVISCNVNIGVAVTINSGSQIGHDVIIGDYCSIMANVDLGGGVVLGDHVFVGSNAVILPGVHIPSHTRIGAGSVVLRSIKSAGTYFGNPAKKIM
ncbi:MAG: hypothetical protein EOO42_15350 [Flavobacteriales bacterium]|nr:MAG: hypothetical protein EOO42_15350 [Flavobacteriales bacterium]